MNLPPSAKLIVNPRQQQNPVLRHIKNVGTMICDCGADYHINNDVGCLFLSMSFHLLNPRYILGRLDAMVGYKQRILLFYHDREFCELVDLAVDCIAKNVTLVMAFSELECARYLETLKLYEKRTPELIKGASAGARAENGHEDVFAEVMTTIKSVNSSDAVQLGTTFGCMKTLGSVATVEELLVCPGLGMKKAKRILDCMSAKLN